MAVKHSLSAENRKVVGRKVKKLRQQGLIPVNVFGKHLSSVNAQVKVKEFEKIYQEVGESTLVYLQIEGEKESRPVLVREVTRHPVSQELLHVDFNQVSLKEKVTAPVKVVLVGESPAEKDKLGILVQQLDEVEVEALPTDMPEHLEVSIERLIAVDDSILVKDLVVDSNKIVIKSDPDGIVAKVEPLPAEEPVDVPTVEDATAPIVEGEGEVKEGESVEEKKEESEPQG